MKYFETQAIERIGFDFYCDIANNIVKARKDKGWTQKDLEKKSGIQESRISDMENVRIRFTLDDLEKLSNTLDVTVNWLIEAEDDCQTGECLYLVWMESEPDLQIYQKATNKRMAFLLFDRWFRRWARYNSSRERFYVKLVGIPVTKKEIQDKFPKCTTEDLPLEPDRQPGDAKENGNKGE